MCQISKGKFQELIIYIISETKHKDGQATWQAVFDGACHLDSGRRCLCRDLPLHLSDVAVGSTTDGGPQKARC